MTELTPENEKPKTRKQASEYKKELEAATTANKEYASVNQVLSEQLAQAKDELATNALEAKKNKVPFNATRFEAEDHDVGRQGTRRFVEGEASLEPVNEQSLDEGVFDEHAKMLMFMAEPVTVEIHEVADEHAEQGFVIMVNGENEVFRRGEIKTVKRYFVEGLARARKTGYRNVEQINPHTGVREFVYPSMTGLRYPFSVTDDRNPRGRDWLKHTLRQP